MLSRGELVRVARPVNRKVLRLGGDWGCGGCCLVTKLASAFETSSSLSRTSSGVSYIPAALRGTTSQLPPLHRTGYEMACSQLETLMSARKGLAVGAGALWRQVSTTWRSPGQALLCREFRTSRSGAKLAVRATLKSARVNWIEELDKEHNLAAEQADALDQGRGLGKPVATDAFSTADREVVSGLASAKMQAKAATKAKERAAEKASRLAAKRAMTLKELEQSGYVVSNMKNSVVLVGTLRTPEDVLRPRQHANLPGAPHVYVRSSDAPPLIQAPTRVSTPMPRQVAAGTGPPFLRLAGACFLRRFASGIGRCSSTGAIATFQRGHC